MPLGLQSSVPKRDLVNKAICSLHLDATHELTRLVNLVHLD